MQTSTSHVNITTFTLSVTMFLKFTDQNITLEVTTYTGIYGNGVATTGEVRSAACLACVTRPNFGEARASVCQWFRRHWPELYFN